jgi:Glycine zipper/Glycine zipper 2TM domain
MIRQRLFILTLIVAALQFGGCVSVQTASGGRTVAWIVPGFDLGERSNRAGTTYYNERWGSDPSSHPAVSGTPRGVARLDTASQGKTAEIGSGSASPADSQTPPAVSPSPTYPPFATRTSREAAADGQTTGAIVGALIGAQAGNRLAGVAVGAASGALIGGKLNDPCQPDANYGSLWGGLAGAWLGSLFGGGRGRDFFIALGAAGGAVRGTERVSDGRRCR